MKIHIDLTQADYQALHKFILARVKAAGRRRSFFSAILLGIPVGAVAGFILAKIHPNDSEGFPFFLAGLVTGVVFIYLLAIASVKWRRNQLRPYDDGCMIGPQEIETNEQGLQILARHHQALFHWSIIPAPEITPDHIFIMVDRTAGVIVPRRCFPTPIQQEAFLTEIRKFAQRTPPKDSQDGCESARQP